MPQLIDNDVTQRVLEMEDAVPVIEDAFGQLHRDDAAFFPRTDIVSPTATDGDYYVWGSLLGAIRDPPRLAFRFKSDVLVWEEHDDSVSEKKFNVEPGTFMGFVLLLDTSTGELLGLMNDGALQHTRVGATAGVACDHLAREDAHRVGILGSGGMAESYLRAFACVRDISKVSVYSPTRAHRREFAADMGAEFAFDVVAVDSAEAAMTGVDIAATCTDSSEPVYQKEWLTDGLFLIDVRSTEIAPAAVEAADRTFGTSTEGYTYRGIGGPAELERYRNLRGVGGFESHDYPTLDELVGEPTLGRESDDETVYYHNRSAGIQFAAVGNLVHERAIERGLGTPLPIEWFQQSIRN